MLRCPQVEGAGARLLHRRRRGVELPVAGAPPDDLPGLKTLTKGRVPISITILDILCVQCTHYCNSKPQTITFFHVPY